MPTSKQHAVSQLLELLNRLREQEQTCRWEYEAQLAPIRTSIAQVETALNVLRAVEAMKQAGEIDLSTLEKELP